jgi:hypothetical protein
MSTDRDTTRIVRSWLRTDEHESADRVLDAVIGRLDTTPQRRATWWPARRLFHMNKALAFGVAAAAVVVVALIGAAFFRGGPDVGGGPEVTPTPLASSSGEAYLITNHDGVRVTLTLPEGWFRGGWLVYNGDEGPGLTAIQVWAVGNVYADPCQWDRALADPPVGPSVDDLAQALASQPTREAATSGVTLDGYTGTLVKMRVPADISFQDCDLGQFRSWLGPGGDGDERYHQGPGQHDDVYILDVDGFRLVIDALYFPGSSAADRAALQQMLDTIQIEPPA